VIALCQMPWWTEADQSELNLLAAEFTRAVFAHREHCVTCRTGGPYCSILREAFDAVMDWRERRCWLSRAVWLRRAQTDAEAVPIAA
jgi:hypothetical protein